MSELRPDLPPIPRRVRRLPVSDGYPVPWFVQWIDGAPDFRVMDLEKFVDAVKLKRCWVCGEPLGKFRTFVIGPMCAVNRTTAEPPCHADCAEFAVRACPFLTQPGRERREKGMPDGTAAPGIGIKRNPGVSLLWKIDGPYRVFRADPGALISLPEPVDLVAYSRGRVATIDELRESFDSGLPLLEELCDNNDHRAELARLVVGARRLLGIE